MRKPARTEEQDHPDRWVVSYADFITLLFAFFTALYAISHVDQEKLVQFSGSMRNAFKTEGVPQARDAVIEGIRPPDYADVNLERELREELPKSGIIEAIISRDERGVVLSLGDRTLFAPGAADPGPAARPLLSAVGALMRRSGRSLRIEGHTDSMPLGASRYASNLELSTARAAAIFVRLLAETGLDPGRFTAAGYGPYRPVTTNATPEGRARNRRVDIIFEAKDR